MAYGYIACNVTQPNQTLFEPAQVAQRIKEAVATYRHTQSATGSSPKSFFARLLGW